ncbi:MAG: GMC family oxidoreductase N-terminal domain-containing protein [Deltaproteobacteria bacterium]|nr:GMC family oxidoreductase N-terminal domain-containing protein [Deltaproteobacteria bacterium]
MADWFDKTSASSVEPLTTLRELEGHYDVIIVGGGSAGCVAATRLSENPARKVLLLEAGPDPQPIPELVAEAANQVRLLLESPYVAMYPTERNSDDSVFYSLAGRIMGGGSSVNVMSVVRPTKFDLDTWVAHGNPDWSYERVLPVMKRIESDQDYPDDPFHGRDGPLYVKRPFTFGMASSAAVQAFIERSLAMGLPLCPDLNVANPLGVCASPYNIKDGKRQSTVVAYLNGARGRSNLTIIDQAQVVSIEFNGTKAEGVRCEKDGKMRTAKGRQIVLCAGVYHTPQILMLSGVGPEEELKRLGIPVVHALAGVGENYQDHPVVYMTFEGTKSFREEWVVPRFRLLIKTNPIGDCANFHIIMRPPTEVEGIKRMIPVSAHLLEQRSRGRLFLKSADPRELPGVDPQMLEDPGDIKAMVSAMEFIAELAEGKPVKEYYGPLIQPRPAEDWAKFARSTYDSYHHGVGTCKMGPASDRMAVVDERLRVHGMENLRIADASVMPTVTHANTNLTCIAIGERLADFIKEAA